MLAFETSTKFHSTVIITIICTRCCVFSLSLPTIFPWYLCFSLASSVKTWFPRLVLTWGRSQRATSPSRLVLYMILLKFFIKEPWCALPLHQLFPPYSHILVHSCGTLEVSLASEACGSVTAVGSVPLCKFISGLHTLTRTSPKW